jgi:glycosyltransferase involved in cell wall biosynthesis
MAANPPGLSIIFLMFNEEGSIAAVLDEAISFADRALPDCELLVIDDGSTDGSAAIVASFSARDPRIRLVQHERNGGMGAGMRTGIQQASKPYFIFNAADGQVPCEEIGKMLPLLSERGIVLSTYIRRADTVSRVVMSRAFRLFLLLAANIRFELEGLYLYPTDLARELLPRISSSSFVFSFELIQRAAERGLPIATTRIRCLPRMAGHSKVTGTRRILFVAGEVLAYRKRRAAEPKELA